MGEERERGEVDEERGEVGEKRDSEGGGLNYLAIRMQLSLCSTECTLQCWVKSRASSQSLASSDNSRFVFQSLFYQMFLKILHE